MLIFTDLLRQSRQGRKRTRSRYQCLGAVRQAYKTLAAFTTLGAVDQGKYVIVASSEIQRRVDAFADIATEVIRSVSTGAERIGLAARIREFARRARRAGLILVGMVAAMVVFSIAITPIPPLLWLLAIPLAVFTSVLSLMWPSRGRASRAALRRQDIPQLAWTARALLAGYGQIPEEAQQVAASVSRRLKEIETSGDGADLDPLVRIELRRLLSEHVPQLLASYSRLPPERQSSQYAREHLREALAAISTELDALCAVLDRRKLDRFDTNRRFITSKYARPAAFMSEPQTKTDVERKSLD